jgi:hypothetical protein
VWWESVAPGDVISFHYFNSSPEVIRLAVMMYIRYGDPSFSLRQGSTFCVAFSICRAVVCSRKPGAGKQPKVSSVGAACVALPPRGRE